MDDILKIYQGFQKAWDDGYAYYCSLFKEMGMDEAEIAKAAKEQADEAFKAVYHASLDEIHDVLIG